MKLWEVTVNNITWPRSSTLFFISRAEAEEARTHFDGASNVRYAGNYNEENTIVRLPREKAIELFGVKKVNEVMNK